MDSLSLELEYRDPLYSQMRNKVTPGNLQKCITVEKDEGHVAITEDTIEVLNTEAQGFIQDRNASHDKKKKRRHTPVVACGDNHGHIPWTGDPGVQFKCG